MHSGEESSRRNNYEAVTCFSHTHTHTHTHTHKPTFAQAKTDALYASQLMQHEFRSSKSVSALNAAVAALAGDGSSTEHNHHNDNSARETLSQLFLNKNVNSTASTSELARISDALAQLLREVLPDAGLHFIFGGVVCCWLLPNTFLLVIF